MPDKIMKTLTIGNTKYTIQDTRVDSLENELDDKLDAPASAGTNGQVLTLNSSGDPVWQNPPTELPSVSSSDNGKMLTVTNGAWAKGSVPTELPSVSSSDNGKILKVTSGAWAKGDVPTELPSVTSSDNGKILKVTNGAWAKGDAPSGLPSVTSSDNGKLLRVRNGVWSTWQQGDTLPSESVDFNALKPGLSQNINDLTELEYYAIKGNVKTSYTKGILNIDGTINRSGNGIVTDIIQSPWYINITSSAAIRIGVYKGDTYLGKINENYELDMDSSTGWTDFGGSIDFRGVFADSNLEDNYGATGVRLCFCDPYHVEDMDITDDDEAANWAGVYIDSFNRIKLALYDYVDNKLNNKLDKPSTAGTTGQVLSLDSSGNPVWQNASGGLPSVTSSDNGKILIVQNGVWTAAGTGLRVGQGPHFLATNYYNDQIIWQQRFESVNESILTTSLNNQISTIDKLASTLFKKANVTYHKASFNPVDGTINLSGYGIVSDIIKIPDVAMSSSDAFSFAFYNGNTYVGKVSADGYALDKDPSTDYWSQNLTSLYDFKEMLEFLASDYGLTINATHMRILVPYTDWFTTEEEVQEYTNGDFDVRYCRFAEAT